MKFKVYLDSAAIVCKQNNLLLSRLYFYLHVNGHEIIQNPSLADFIFVSTCGFDKSHEEYSLGIFKKYNMSCKSRLVSVGCLNKINPEVINLLDPTIQVANEGIELDRIFFRQVKFDDVREYYTDDRINKEINIERMHHKERKLQNKIGLLLAHLFRKSELYAKMSNEINRRNKSYVVISRGCVQNCAYCVIKKACGNVASRSPEDILQNIDRIYSPDKNLGLIADDCGCYGLDTGTSFPALLEKIHERYPGIKIDIPYINPNWLVKYEKEYTEFFKKMNVVIFSMPIQSGSNRIIKAMNRNYDIHQVLGVLDRIKAISPSTVFLTQVIVGFPGETWTDFFKTLKAIRKFHGTNPFAYSDREGALSHTYKDKKSKAVILIRYVLAISFSTINMFSKVFKDLVSHKKKLRAQPRPLHEEMVPHSDSRHK